MINKFIVYIGSEGCEAIIDVTLFSEQFIEMRLLSSDNSNKAIEEDYPLLKECCQKINSMEWKMRYNTQRNIEAYIYEGNLSSDEIYDSTKIQTNIKTDCIKYNKGDK